MRFVGRDILRCRVGTAHLFERDDGGQCPPYMLAFPFWGDSTIGGYFGAAAFPLVSVNWGYQNFITPQ